MRRARVAEFRKLLETRRLELTAALKPMRCESTCPNHDEKQAEADALEFHLILAGKNAGILRQVEEALERLERGEYGTCTECGSGIAEDRLRALLIVERCTSCQQTIETVQRLYRASGRTAVLSST